MGYDIIGDIHGQAGKLESLLLKLGYERQRGVWRHGERQAVFVGDFIDGGPEQVRTVMTVRRMVEAGAALAVMGNHKLNAIAWHTPDPQTPGEYLRRRYCQKWDVRNRGLHGAFLEEVEHRPGLHAEIIEWFLSLPLWLDLPAVRVVHACWHQPLIDWAAPRLHNGCHLTRELMADATENMRGREAKGGCSPDLSDAVGAITKGLAVALPGGHWVSDRYGHRRRQVRVRWWDESATTYRSAALAPEGQRAGLPDLPIPNHLRIGVGSKPTFFGHYWMTGRPVPQLRRSACVDYSAGYKGPLTAYRFDGETELSAGKFAQAA